MPAIPPGTTIDTGPPAGWSHLLFKVKPRYKPDGESGIPAALVRVTNTFFLAALVRTGQQPGDGGPRYVLETVALGIGATCTSGDRISSAEEKGLPAELSGWMVKSGLRALQKDVAPSAVVARASNLWVFDTPVKVMRDEQVALITRRYAVWAAPRTGEVSALFWDLETGGAATPPDGPVFLLQPALAEEMPLLLNKGLGGGSLFALGRRPTSTELRLPAAWRAGLNESPLQEPTVRQLAEELARRPPSSKAPQ
jgi:hypothetical protein